MRGRLRASNERRSGSGRANWRGLGRRRVHLIGSENNQSLRKDKDVPFERHLEGSHLCEEVHEGEEVYGCHLCVRRGAVGLSATCDCRR